MPRRAVAWSQPLSDVAYYAGFRFQCPEGLLLGRNSASGQTRVKLTRVSVPRRAVAWSQQQKSFCFQVIIHVSVPRRAVAWSQPSRRCGMRAAKKCFSAPKGCCLVATRHGRLPRSSGNRFSAPKGCCLVATTSGRDSITLSVKFQCPEGLLLGRNDCSRMVKLTRWKRFSAPKGCCLVATEHITKEATNE